MKWLVFILFITCNKTEVSYHPVTAGWKPRPPLINLAWSSVQPNAAFSGRDGQGFVKLGSTYYMFGGWSGLLVPPTNNEVWSSTDCITWTQLADAPWTIRHSFGNFEFNNLIWVIGGDYNTDIWTFDGNTWTEVNSNAACLQNKRVMICGVHDNKMWVIGGWKEEIVGSSVNITQYDDVWSSTDGVTWTLVNSSPGFTPRGAVYGLPSFNGKMWVVGGGMLINILNINDPNPSNRIPVYAYYNDVWSSVDGTSWTEEISGIWTGKTYNNAVVFDSKIWTIAGWDGFNNKRDTYYSTNGTDWIPFTDIPWGGRHAASVYVDGSTLYLIGGSEDSAIKKDVWKLQ